jgi:transcriptional antiterminator NusG
MPTIPEPTKQWYVIHVLSGQEQKVAQRIRNLVELEEMKDNIYDVLVPTEMISEIKRGKKSETKRKFYPGYIIVNMNLFTVGGDLVEDTWYFVKEVDGIIGFAGTKDVPIPMRQREVDQMLAQIKEREESIRPAISFEVGDTVKVADGPFESQTGIVEEIDPEKGKLRVAVSIFGRSTPVELEFWQVEKA